MAANGRQLLLPAAVDIGRDDASGFTASVEKRSVCPLITKMLRNYIGLTFTAHGPL
jgi:hypothetical protein